MSLERAFEVDELLLDEVTSVLTGASDPSIALLDRPIGSLYLRTNGELWQKVSSPPNGWSKLEAGSSSGETFGNADGGLADSIYGGVTPVDGGNASGS